MKKLKLFAPLLALSIALASCTGDDGEPGLQGETGAAGATGATGAAGAGFEKVGYFQGTVSGNRTDGTAFSEAFKYEYGSSIQGFTDINGIKSISLYRGDNHSSYLQASGLELSGNALVSSPTNSSIYFEFLKELNSTDLFQLEARPYFSATESYIKELSDEQNKTYLFSTTTNNGTSTLYYYQAGYYDNNSNYIPVYLFYSYQGNDSYEIDYNQTTGALSRIRNQSTNTIITSGALFDLYNKLVFKNNPTVSKFTFFDKATGNSLHTALPAVPADQFTTTNYAFDATTGVLSFDFTLKISQYRSKADTYNVGRNTTGHDLTITGSFNSGSKVYKNVVGRTASGG